MTSLSQFSAFSLLSNGEVVIALCAFKRDADVSPDLLRLLVRGARDLAAQEHPGAIIRVVLPWRLGSALLFIDADVALEGDDEYVSLLVVEDSAACTALRNVLPETEWLANSPESSVDARGLETLNEEVKRETH
jgi:hypothetical protein